MLSSTRTRLLHAARHTPRLLSRASYSSTATLRSDPLAENPNPANTPNPPKPVSPVSGTNATPTDAMGGWDAPLQESPETAQRELANQAPNRATTWARSQQAREKAMTGPRFEQTMMEYQPRPYAAIELIHKQPVRWTHEKVVSCDGGGGPLGHPRIFINTDKPEIVPCGYCGLPFANEHNRAKLEAQPTTTYPLKPTGDPAEINESQRITPEGYEQR